MQNSILFTGHMIDKKSRDAPRFPVSKEFAVVAELRKQLVKKEILENNLIIGIAGGACGGDIIFHEVCEEIGIKSEMYLALPIKEYKKKSVSFAGKAWGIRFDQLIEKLPVHILSLEKRKNIENIWAVTNLWMLDTAIQIGGKNSLLIALWDRKGGDGKGGTEHMINTAKDKGAKINIININKIPKHD